MPVQLPVVNIQDLIDRSDPSLRIETIVLEPAREIAISPIIAGTKDQPAHLEPVTHGNVGWSPKQYTTSQIRLHCLSGDISVFSSLGVVIVGNRVIRESLYGGFIPGTGALQRIGSQLFLELSGLPAEPSIRVERACHAMAGSIGSGNFGHFWVDAVSVFQFAIKYSQLMFAGAEYLISPHSIPYHGEAFELLSAASAQPFTYHELGPLDLARVNTLYYIEGLHDIWRPRSTFADFARSLSETAAQSISPERRVQLDKYSRLLYISRRDSASRARMLNEREVESFLTKKGFDVIVRSDWNISESIYLFSRARVLAGENGSNLMNIIFCPVGSHLIEFHHSEYVKWDFRHFGSAARAQYSCLVGSSVDSSPGDRPNTPKRARPWRIELAELESLLASIL